MDALVLLGPVTWYVFVMIVTPGPNNMMLTASGMNVGYRRTVPHLLGIGVGFGLLMAACGYGLGAVFQEVPEARTALAVVGSAYLAYLAWRIANAAAPTANEGAKPLSFFEAFGFQFLNPKGWVMALTAATLMPALGSVEAKAVTLGIMAALIGVPCMSIWAAFGSALATLFQQAKWRRIINWTLAALLLATIPFMFT
jgi:threonine/homoserine/homoserine lactone efflux protein